MKKKFFIFGLGALLFFNILAWRLVFEGNKNEVAAYFLDVGQGDSQLIKINQANFLIDAGRNDLVLKNLERILPFYQKRIDVLFISHPQEDHVKGIFSLVRNYEIGAVIFNGQEISFWPKLASLFKANNIPFFALTKGDEVVFGKNYFQILWPETNFGGKLDENDASLVVAFRSNYFSALFLGDISSKVEKILLNSFDFSKIKVDVLKVAHHGSKYSSDFNFLKAVSPKVAVIEVGKNSYGHPTSEVLERLANLKIEVFRTDKDGIIKIFSENNLLKAAKSLSN